MVSRRPAAAAAGLGGVELAVCALQQLDHVLAVRGRRRHADREAHRLLPGDDLHREGVVPPAPPGRPPGCAPVTISTGRLSTTSRATWPATRRPSPPRTQSPNSSPP